MSKVPLDIYDNMPPAMERYITNYGWHFNSKAYKYATRLMKKRNGSTNMVERVKPFTKDEVEELLEKHNITIENDIMYDHVFVATMCRADYEKAIPDEKHLAYYIKETVDDVDASDETTFRRWVATMIGNGSPIDWNEIC